MKTIIKNNTVKINEITLRPLEETGIHLHEYDYVIVPITDGKLISFDNTNIKTEFSLKKGEPYFRKAGVEHNILNNSNHEVKFIEIEIVVTN